MKFWKIQFAIVFGFEKKIAKNSRGKKAEHVTNHIYLCSLVNWNKKKSNKIKNSMTKFKSLQFKKSQVHQKLTLYVFESIQFMANVENTKWSHAFQFEF